MIAGTANLTVEQGTSFERKFGIYSDVAQTTPIPLAGYTFASEVRSDWDKTLICKIKVTVTDEANGKITLSLDPADTKTVRPGDYKWDLLVIMPDGKVRKYIKGTLTVLATQSKLPV